MSCSPSPEEAPDCSWNAGTGRAGRAVGLETTGSWAVLGRLCLSPAAFQAVDVVGNLRWCSALRPMNGTNNVGQENPRRKAQLGPDTKYARIILFGCPEGYFRISRQDTQTG